MNIYITENSLSESARNLDNYRLKIQIIYLEQIISNILSETDAFDELLEARGYPNYRYMLLPVKHSSHSAVKWAKKSSLHLFFVCEYYRVCISAYRDRGLPVGIFCSKNFYLWIGHIYDKLCKLLSISQLNALINLEKELYINVVDEAKDEKTTIQAYRKHLIIKWKEEFTIKAKANKAYSNWKALPEAERDIIKPRHAARPIWGKYDLGTYVPKWAREELLKHVKDIENAA